MASFPTADPLQDIIERSSKYMKACYLQPFVLSLPLTGPAASSNQAGIRDKIMKNKSYVVTPQNPRTERSRDSSTSVEVMNEFLDRLTSVDLVGFVLVIAEYLGPANGQQRVDVENISAAAYQYRPIAGGIVEMLDENERAVRAVWCRRSFPAFVCEELLTVCTVRLLAHAFEWQPPTNSKRVNSKLVSAFEVHGLIFPRQTYDFLTTPAGLNLSKHWETQQDGGAHNDSPNQRCKCFKLADKSESWQFWGISESRFIKTWNARKDSLIPHQPSKEVVRMFEDCASSSDPPLSFKRDGPSCQYPEPNCKRREVAK